MTATDDRQLEIRSIAKKYLNEREPSLRTGEPLRGDYEAFRREVTQQATEEDIRRFEEEWADVYEQVQ